jgi:DGQHR domain-containing protein
MMKLNCIKVHQWLDVWDQIDFTKTHRRKPDPHFFMFSIKAKDLRRLSNVHRRKATGPRISDLGIQRELREERSQEIAYFLEGGYPWSVLSERQKEDPSNNKLRMPGWLPTSIIANILAPGPQNNETSLPYDEAVKIEDANGQPLIVLPEKSINSEWKPSVSPINIIDGQHRLMALDFANNMDQNFELPVIAFYNLDITWQAYLFYTINIKPKRIKPSLAYDLFPILRTQDWLEKSPDGLTIYKETRAQELTEILWDHEKSPWYKRINMLDIPGEGAVTQASFIRSLLNSFVKTSETSGDRIGGLFGASERDHEFIAWDRFQQGAFLICCWKAMELACQNLDADWAKSLEDPQSTLFDSSNNAAFTSKYSLLSTDQGVRAFQNIANDTFMVSVKDLNLPHLFSSIPDNSSMTSILGSSSIDVEYINTCIEIIDNNTEVSSLLSSLCLCLSSFDWRTSAAPGISDPELQTAKKVFRGSGGYKELRMQLLSHLAKNGTTEISTLATLIAKRLGYNK